MANPLTKQTNREQGAQMRSDRCGTWQRAAQRSAQWAQWMVLTRHGIAIPADAVLAPVAGGLWQFQTGITIRGYTESILGPRGGFKGHRWVPERIEHTPIGPAFVPPGHAQACKYADRWHFAHQAGYPLATCHEVGQGWRPMDMLTPDLLAA